MRPLTLTVLACLAFAIITLSTVTAAPSIFDSKAITQLKADSFKEALKKENEVYLVAFCTARNTKCKEFSQQYNALARSIKPEFLTVSHVDCKADSNLCEEQDVKEENQPVVRLYVNKKSYTYKSQELKQKELSEWVWAAFPNHVTQMKDKTEKKEGVLRSEKEQKKGGGRDKSVARVILFTDKRITGPLWKSLALTFRSHADKVIFSEVRKGEKKLLDFYGIGKNFPVIMIEPPVKPGEDEKSARRYEGKFEKAHLAKWIAEWISVSTPGAEGTTGDAAAADASAETGKSLTPIPELVDQSCMERYCNSGPLCVVLFLSKDHPELQSTLTKFAQIEQAAKAHKNTGRVNFVYADSVVAPHSTAWLAESFDMQPQDYPQLILLAARKQRFAPYVGALSTEGVIEFLTGVTKGLVRTVPFMTRDKKLPSLPEGSACPKPTTPERETPREEASKSTPPPKDEGELIDLTPSNHATEVLKSVRPWVILLHNKNNHAEKYVNLTSDFGRVAVNMKDMVFHGSFDLSSGPEAQEFLSFYGIASVEELPVIVSLPHKPSDKTSENVERFTGDLATVTAKDIRAFAQQRLAPAQVLIVNQNSMQQFMGDIQPNTPFPPKMILFSKPSAGGEVVVPDMLKALSLEFGSGSEAGGEFTFGVASSREHGLARQFNVTKIPAVFVMGQQEDPPGAEPSNQIRVAANQYGGNIVYSELQLFCEQVQRGYQQQKLQWLARAGATGNTKSTSSGSKKSGSSGSSGSKGKKEEPKKKDSKKDAPPPKKEQQKRYTPPSADEDDDHVDLDASSHDEL